MKPDQRLSHAERIEHAVRLLEASVEAGQAPGLADLAGAAAVSPPDDG